MDTTTIKIKRTNEFINMARNYKIFIDGQFVGKIANGATKDFPTTSGQHTVIAKIDWCSSPSISVDISTNETKYLIVGNFKYGSWLMFIGLILICFLPMLRVIFGFGYATYFLLMPVVLLLCCYITFGRKKYLTLIETK